MQPDGAAATPVRPSAAAAPAGGTRGRRIRAGDRRLHARPVSQRPTGAHRADAIRPAAGLGAAARPVQVLAADRGVSGRSVCDAANQHEQVRLDGCELNSKRTEQTGWLTLYNTKKKLYSLILYNFV